MSQITKINGVPIANTSVSSFTYGNNVLTIGNTNGNTYTATINTMTGLTVNGTLSATTFVGNGSGLTGLPSYEFTGGTVSGSTTFTNNVTINTSSSSPSFQINQIGSGPAILIEDTVSPDSSPFVVDNTGKVGIGMTTPLRKLDVADNTIVVAQFEGKSSSGLLLDMETAGSSYNGFRFYSGGTHRMSTTYIPTGDYYQIGSSWATGNEIMVVTRGGNVGINTTTPTQKLQVDGNILSSGNISGSTFFGSGAGLTGLPSATFNGGTVTGSTTFTNGLTTNTISATTYQNLPSNNIYISTTGVDSYSGDTSPSITNITTGTTLQVHFLSANTTTGATLNIPSIGSKSIRKGNVDLLPNDILDNGVYTLFYNGTFWEIIGYGGVRRSFNWVDFPARVTSTVAGSAPTITLITNTRIVRTLTRAAGTNQNTVFYFMFYIPDDFISFPTNAFKIESAKNTANATLTTTFGTNGVADSTINNLSVIATGTGDVFETKFATPGSTYIPGDLVLVVVDMAVTTNNANVIRLGMCGLDYISR